MKKVKNKKMGKFDYKKWVTENKYGKQLTEAKVQAIMKQHKGKVQCICYFDNGMNVVIGPVANQTQCTQACNVKKSELGGKEMPISRDLRYDDEMMDANMIGERALSVYTEGREHLSREGGMCRCNGKRYSTSFCGLSCDCCDSDGWWSGMSVVSYDFEDKGDMAMGDMSRSDMDMDRGMMDMDRKFSMRDESMTGAEKGVIKEEEDKKDEGHGYSMEELKAMMEETDNEGKMMNESLFAAIGGLVGVLGAAGVTSAIEMALEDPAIAEKYPKLAKVFEFLAKVGGAVGKGIK